MTKRTKINVSQWETLGYDGKRPTDIIAVLTDRNGALLEAEAYAVSPDGYGAYYYDTLEALEEDYALDETAWKL